MWRMCQVGRCVAVLIATALCTGLLVQGVAAQTPPPPKCDANDPKTLSCTTTTSKTTLDSTGAPKTVTQQTAVTTPYGTTSWQGLNWGIGIAADFDLGGSRVTKAQFDSANIVRVTDASGNVGVSFVLEAHYFLKEWFPQPKCMELNCTEYALGPFVAIEVGGGATATPTNGPITGYVGVDGGFTSSHGGGG
jgi:hypothetical protein